MLSGTHTVIELDGARMSALWGDVRAGSVAVAGWCSAVRPEGVAADDARAVGAWLDSELSAANVPRGRVTLAAGRSEVVLKRLMLPRVEGGAVEGELAGMVRLQMMRQITVGGESASVDYVAGKATDAGIPTLAAAMPGERLAWYQECAKAAGLKVVRLGLKCTATAALLADITQRRGGLSLGVGVGASSTEFVMIEQGGLEAARAIELPRPEADDEVATAAFAERLAVEVRRTWASHRSTRNVGGGGGGGAGDGGDLEGVLVVGEDGLSETIAIRCGAALECRGETVRLPRMVAIPQGMGESSRGMAGALVGLLVQHAEDVPTLDFLHPRRAPDASAAFRQRALVAAAGVLLLGGAAYVLADMSLRSLRSELATMTAMESQLRRERDEMLVRHARVKHLSTWMGEPVDWVAHARVLSDAAPDGRLGLVRELSGQASFDAVFAPDGVYPRGRWTSDQPITMSIDGTVSARQVASLFRTRLLEGGVYDVANKGAEVPDRYALVLTTRRRDAALPPPPSERGAKPSSEPAKAAVKSDRGDDAKDEVGP